MLDSDCKNSASWISSHCNSLVPWSCDKIYCFFFKRWENRHRENVTLFRTAELLSKEFPDFQPQVLSQITVHSHTGRVYKLQVKKSRMTSLDADLRIRNRNMVPSCFAKVHFRQGTFFTASDVCLQTWAKKLEAQRSVTVSH